MLKNTENSINRAMMLSNTLSIDKDFIENLYRKEMLSMRRIAEKLKEQDDSITLKDINALFEFFSIVKMTPAEQKIAAKARPVNTDNLKKKILEIEEIGFSKSAILSIYNSGSSKNGIIEKINDAALYTAVNKTWLKKMFDFWEVDVRSESETNKIRMNKINATLEEKRNTEKFFGKGHSKDEIIEFYLSGLSLTKIYATYGVSPVTASRILKDSGVEVKRDIPAVETIQQLQEAGVTAEIISKMYLDDNCSFKSLKEFMSEKIDRHLGDKAVTTVLSKLEIKKSKEQLKERQGAKSRAELASNMDKLNRAGFESLKKLAEHYESDLTLTKQALITSMNKTILEGETPFTERWLQSRMDPHLSEDRLRGSSRIEKEFIEAVKTLTSHDLTENSRSIIAPYELDVYIPDLNVAFEFNGDYWHSDKFMKVNHGMSAEEYHLMKFGKCADKGIKLFFVWESDWVSDRSAVEQSILEVLKRPHMNPALLSKLTRDITKVKDVILEDPIVA